MDPRLPAILHRLRSASATWGYFAGSFELEDEGPSSALAWFAGDAGRASGHVVFGREAAGGLYALELEEGRAIDGARVVFLGGEGKVRVLASNTREFLSLLALDPEELGDIVVFEPAGTPGHAAFEAWLTAEGVALAEDPEALIAAAELAAAGGARQAPLSEIPLDPVALLNQPRPTVRLDKKSGVELKGGRDGLTKTVWLKPGRLAATLRPRGLALFTMERAGIAAALGPPTKSNTTSDAAWDRFDQGDVAVHVQFGATGDVVLVTLMWIPSLPPSLR
jgi:hypothetical protein